MRKGDFFFLVIGGGMKCGKHSVEPFEIGSVYIQGGRLWQCKMIAISSL